MSAEAERRLGAGLARGRTRVRALRARMPYLVFRAGETAVAAVPHRAAYAIAGALGRTAVAVRPARFEALRRNLRAVLPEATPHELELVVRANVANLMRCWVDVMEMRSRGAEFFERIRIVDVENVLEPFRRGRGVVVVSLHLGSWEVGLAGWNHHTGGTMALLAERLRPIELFEHIAGGRRHLGVDVIPIDTQAMREATDPSVSRRLAATSLREVMRTLRRGGMVAIAMDRDLTGTGEPMTFFGRAASIPMGVVDMGIRSGSAIIVAILLRSGDHVVAPVVPEITYNPDPAVRDAEVRRVTECILRIFEGVISEHPDQWHVLTPIWEAGFRGGVPLPPVSRAAA